MFSDAKWQPIRRNTVVNKALYSLTPYDQYNNNNNTNNNTITIRYDTNRKI